jgi:hypothetical protein
MELSAKQFYLAVEFVIWHMIRCQSLEAELKAERAARILAAVIGAFSSSATPSL